MRERRRLSYPARVLGLPVNPAMKRAATAPTVSRPVAGWPLMCHRSSTPDLRLRVCIAQRLRQGGERNLGGVLPRESCFLDQHPGALQQANGPVQVVRQDPRALLVRQGVVVEFG